MNRTIVSNIKRDIIGAVLYEHRLISFNALVVINDLIKAEDWETIHRILNSIKITISYDVENSCSIVFSKETSSKYGSEGLRKKPQCHSIW